MGGDISLDFSMESASSINTEIWKTNLSVKTKS